MDNENATAFPALIHQILILDNQKLPSPLPPRIRESSQSLAALYPKASRKIWNGEELSEFIQREFGREIFECYTQLAPYSYKSDLARAALLHHFGGLYVDIGVRLINAFEPPPECGFASFRDRSFLSPSWVSVNGGIILAHPKRRELALFIDYILENWRQKFYGRNPLYPTGPVPLGRAIAAAKLERPFTEDPDDQWIGVFEPLSADPAGGDQGLYVAPDGTLVAARIKHKGGDLSSFGLEGTNNYNVLWRQRRAYGETASRWDALDDQIRLGPCARRGTGSIIARTEKDEVITYGPYTALPRGSYQLTVFFSRPLQFPLSVDVTRDCGSGQIHKSLLRPSREEPVESSTMQFSVTDDSRDVEFRIFSAGHCEVEISGFLISPAPAS